MPEKARKPAPLQKILCISASLEDHDALRRILAEPGWRIISANSCQQAIQCLCRDRVEVILCDANLPDATWRDILSQIADLTNPPALIVAGGEPDVDLRAQVRALGGCDVLAKPLSQEQARSVLYAALNSRAAAPAIA
ncbi:MAG TPA: response regulator [Bryobacteraceae bacterium]|nr:response regulator [Bryobacteraceae bacterium]